MTTITSFSNKNRLMILIKQDLKKLRLHTLLYTVVGFLALPLQYILTISRYAKMGTNHQMYFSGAANIYTSAEFMFWMFTATYAIIISSVLMSYNYNKRAVDVYYAMPFTRRQMMLSHIISGAVALIVPIMINFAITLIAQNSAQYAMFVVRDCLVWSTFILFIFLSFMLVGSFMGNSMDSVLFGMGVNCTIPFVYLMLEFIMTIFVAGYFNEVGMMEFLTYSHPLAIAIMILYSSETAIFAGLNLFWIGIWILTIPLMAFVTIEFFAKREAEVAESIGKDNWLRIVEKIVGIFLGSNLFAILIVSMMGLMDYSYPTIGDIWQILPAIIFGAGLVYVIIELILARGFKTVKQNLWICCVAAAVSLAVIAGAGTGLFGFESAIPSTADIESIEIEGERFTAPEVYSANRSWKPVVFVEKENIEAITVMHKRFIDTIAYVRGSRGVENENFRYNAVNMKYNLKNGSAISRKYYAATLENEKELAKIQMTNEAIRQIDPIFVLNENSIKSLTVLNATASDGAVLPVGDKTAVKRLIDAIRADTFANIDNTKAFEKNGGYYLDISYDIDFYQEKEGQQTTKLTAAQSVSNNEIYIVPDKVNIATDSYESIRRMQIIIPSEYKRSTEEIEHLLSRPLAEPKAEDVYSVSINLTRDMRYKVGLRRGAFGFGEAVPPAELFNSGYYFNGDFGDMELNTAPEVIAELLESSTSRFNLTETDDLIMLVHFKLNDAGAGFTKYLRLIDAPLSVQKAVMDIFNKSGMDSHSSYVIAYEMTTHSGNYEELKKEYPEQFKIMGQIVKEEDAVKNYN